MTKINQKEPIKGYRHSKLKQFSPRKGIYVTLYHYEKGYFIKNNKPCPAHYHVSVTTYGDYAYDKNFKSLKSAVIIYNKKVKEYKYYK